MTESMANAYPKKNFFIEMFTRDISLEDCILDLIDNSIDGLMRSKKISPEDVTKHIFKSNGNPSESKKDLPTVKVHYSKKGIEIEDTCGGIELDYALQEAFNFGHSPSWQEGYLGVYGIGLKRALFKIGNSFHIHSNTGKTAFTCDVEVDKWVKRDATLEDWRIPLKTVAVDTHSKPGTRIKITRLHEEVMMRLEDGTVDAKLTKDISRSYAFFLGSHVRIELNDVPIQPFSLPLGKAKDGSISYEKFKQDGVNVRIYASIAAPDENQKWSSDRAGWYVICNGRVVLAGDHTEQTGWGIGAMPTYQPKHRFFIGLVFFDSDRANLLPWTTTKRDLNKESPVYLRVRNKMTSAAKPVISFINKRYSSDPDESQEDKEIASRIEKVSVAEVSLRKTDFHPPVAAKKTTVKVQYDAEKEDLDVIKKHLRRPSMSASAVGEQTFEYFLKQEGLK